VVSRLSIIFPGTHEKGRRKKEEGRRKIKKSKEESGSTFGCFSDFLILTS
jgi:hypothetical protein